jgi:Cu2+-exporting ATPase
MSVGGDWNFAVNRAVTVLVITCPHALGLAIPLVIVNATGLSARHGILVRHREAFERARNIKAMAFDKTGTLTEGEFGVQRIVTEGIEQHKALAIAAALESLSEHPLAQAMVREAQNQRVPSAQASNFQSVTGQGVEGMIDGKRYRVGRPEWAEVLGLKRSALLQDGLQTIESRGESAIALFDDTQVLAFFGLADQVRTSAREAVQQLHRMGLKVVMITGDAEAVAKTVAADLGIDRYYARVLPQDKAALISRLRQEQPTAFCDRSGNECGDRICRSGAGKQQPTRCDLRPEASKGNLQQNDSKSLLGNGVQRACDSSSRRRCISTGNFALASSGCCFDESVHRYCVNQRRAAANCESPLEGLKRFHPGFTIL